MTTIVSIDLLVCFGSLRVTRRSIRRVVCVLLGDSNPFPFFLEDENVPGASTLVLFSWFKHWSHQPNKSDQSRLCFTFFVRG